MTTIGTEKVIPLIYLWTRDAGLEPGPETERYVLDQLEKVQKEDAVVTYSDLARAHMACRIHNMWLTAPGPSLLPPIFE